MVLLEKNLPACAGDIRDAGSIPGWGRSPGERAWQPTPVFLPGECRGQRSLAGHSPQDHTQSDTTEATYHRHAHFSQACTLITGMHTYHRHAHFRSRCVSVTHCLIWKLMHDVIYSFLSGNYLCLFQSTMESYLKASECN